MSFGIHYENMEVGNNSVKFVIKVNHFLKRSRVRGENEDITRYPVLHNTPNN